MGKVMWVLLAILFLGCESCDKEKEGSIQKSEVMLERERKIERARAGLPTDFDGDGFEEYFQWEENGVLYVEIKSPDGDFSWFSERHPDGTKIILYDSDGDGKVDEKIEERLGSQIYYISSNGDRVFDERVTLTFDFEKGEKYRLFEEINPDGSARKITLEDTVPIFPETPLPLEMSAVSGAKESFIQEPHKNTYEPIGPGVRIATGGPGVCTSGQRNRVLSAFDSIYSGKTSYLTCLSETNPEVGAKLKDIFDNETIINVDMDCGNNTKASATAWHLGSCGKKGCPCTTPGQCGVSFNPKTFGLGDTLFMNIVLHEYLHVLGYNLNDPNHKKGTDTAYACGAYCAGCDGSTDDRTNCENCAGKNSKQKKQCNPKKGVKEILKTDSCPEAFGVSRHVCGSGFACYPPKACERCTYTVQTDCDGKETGELGRLLCCNSCPSSCDWSEIKCSGGSYPLVNTCGQSSTNQPPPFCKGGTKNP